MYRFVFMLMPIFQIGNAERKYSPEVVGPLSVVSTIGELLERKSSGCGPEIQEYGGRNPSR
jgi:hypothetical protein